MLTDEKPSPDQDVEPVIVDFARKLKRKSVPLLKVWDSVCTDRNDPEAATYFKPLDNALKARHKLDRDVSEQLRMQDYKD